MTGINSIYNSVNQNEAVTGYRLSAADGVQAGQTPADQVSEMTESVNQIYQGASVNRDYGQFMESLLASYSESDVQTLSNLQKQGFQALQTLADTMTDVDLKAMIEDGLNPEKTSMELLAQVVKNNKSVIGQGDLETLEASYKQGIEDLKDSYGDSETLTEISDALKEANLPVTKKNVDRLMKGLDIAEMVNQADAGDRMKLLDLSDSLGTPTLEEAYRQLKGPEIPVSGQMLTDATAEDLVTGYLEKEGQIVTGGRVSAATDMLQREVALSVDAIDYLAETEPISETIDKSDLLKSMAEAIASGDRPLGVIVDALNFYGDEGADQVMSEPVSKERQLELETLMAKFNGLSDAHIAGAVEADQDSTIADLVQYSDQVAEETVEASEKSLDYVQRRLQVEEIRLKMTTQAALRLEQSGLEIDTAPIEEVVEGLREEEQRLIEAKVDAYSRPGSDVDVQAVKETVASAGYAGMRHEDTEAQLMKQGMPVTLENLTEVSFELKGLHGQNPYEETMTEIRPDLGDRIEKTFDQIEPMLNEMDMEATEANQKAVQILARNGMAITEESVTEIQLLQEKVEFALSNMTPLTAVRIIEAGINPMDLSIDELNSFILSFEGSEGMTGEEKISQMIQALDQSGDLREEQRQGLMAVYRTFDTVLRSDGGATGFLVKRDMALTVEGLFEAAKFMRQTSRFQAGIQANIDDGFGMLESAPGLDQSLRNQMGQAVDSLSGSRGGSSAMSPAQQVQQALMDVRVQNFVHALTSAGAENLLTGSSAASNSALPLEELTSLMQGWQAADAAGSARADLYTQLMDSDPAVLMTMVNNRIPMTFGNFQQAMAMSEDTFLLMDQLETMVEGIEDSDLKSSVLDLLQKTADEVLKGGAPYNRLSEALDTVESMLQNSEASSAPQAFKAAEGAAKTLLHTQMIQVTEDYYQIPVMMDGQIHQLNMFMLGDGESSGQEGDEMKVVMSFDTKHLGKVQASLNIRGNLVQMNISSDQPSEAGSLEAFEAAFAEAVDRTNFTLEGISYKQERIKEPVEARQPIVTSTKVSVAEEGHVDFAV